MLEPGVHSAEMSLAPFVTRILKLLGLFFCDSEVRGKSALLTSS
jgi:hypothetical protein